MANSEILTDDRTLPETFPTVKWVFPTSKLRESARFKVEMSQWFDMWSTENPQERKEVQVEGLRESIAFILSIIRKEASLVPPERIVLAGISQGCATAIYALLYGGIQLGGFIGLCGWLPFADQVCFLSSDFAVSFKFHGGHEIRLLSISQIFFSD
jgi:predicted esterase